MSTILQTERQDVEYLSDLFSCVVAIEQVEKAHRREFISADEYKTAVERLLQKYNTVLATVSSGNAFFTTSDAFLREYCSRYHAAVHTIQMGPVNLSSETKLSLARQVMDCTQLFITLLDALRLQQTAVDKLNPLLADLLGTLKKINVRDKDFFKRLTAWHQKMNQMNAADLLDENSVRQFEYDLDRGYSDLRAMMEADQ